MSKTYCKPIHALFQNESWNMVELDQQLREIEAELTGLVGGHWEQDPMWEELAQVHNHLRNAYSRLFELAREAKKGR